MKSLEPNNVKVDVSKILAELKAEREQIEKTISQEHLLGVVEKDQEGHLIGWPM